MHSWRKIAALIGLPVVAMIAVALWPTALGGNTSYVTTHGASMAPSFHDGDLAVVRMANHYEVGDVVAYRSHLLDTIVLHRIVAERGDRFVFKGDNNSWRDRERPSQQDLVGKLWMHVPHAGAALDLVHGQLPFVAGALGLLAVGGISTRRRARRKVPAESRPYPGGGLAPATLQSMCVALAVAALAGAALAAFAWTRPSEELRAVPLHYEENGTFAYGAAAADPSVYENGRVDTGEPVYLRVVDRIDVGFRYRFSAASPHSVRGTIALRAVVADTNGWKREIVLQPPQPMTGDRAEVGASLDLAAIQLLVAGVETATDVRDGTYSVTLTPDVQTEATIDGQAATGDFRPQLTFALDQGALRVAQPGDASAATFTPSRSGTLPRRAVGRAHFTVLGVKIPVAAVRSGAALLAVVAGAGALIALLLVRRRATNESDRIALRYRRLLVPATDATHLTRTPVVDVATVADLARVAEQTNQLIVHRDTDHGHVYVCFAGNATYRYTIDTDPVADTATGPPILRFEPGSAPPRVRSHSRRQVKAKEFRV